MNEGNSLDSNTASSEMILLHYELDFGLSMAELALASLLLGERAESDGWKNHALDALTSASATAARLSIVDTTASNQLNELAVRVSAL